MLLFLTLNLQHLPHLRILNLKSLQSQTQHTHMVALKLRQLALHFSQSLLHILMCVPVNLSLNRLF